MMHIPSFVQYWLLGGELCDELAQLAYSGVLQTPIAMPITMPVVPSQIIYLITAFRHA